MSEYIDSGHSGVSVVICTHTEARWNYLMEAVSSVQNQSLPPVEIIVVIDHNPALLEKVRDRLPGVVAVENKELQGAAGSKNSGIAASRGDVIAFLDDDAAATPQWLELLLPEFENPSVMGVGGGIYPKWTGEKPNWMPEEFYWVVGCTYKGLPETAGNVRNLIACNMAVRKWVFNEAGKFINDIGPNGKQALGCEETEFCIRASQKFERYFWFYQPKAVVYHQVPKKRQTWRYFFQRCFGEGLSKALVSNYVGTTAGLASERSYIVRVLTRGILNHSKRALLDGDWYGVQRAAAIVGGLTVTSLGFFKGYLTNRTGLVSKQVIHGAFE